MVSSPFNTVKAFFILSTSSDFWKTIAVTGWRFIAGFAGGTACGALLGMVCGFNIKLEKAFEPVLWVLMSVPPVVLVMINMILFGMGTLQTVVVSAVLILPIMYTNTLEGIKSIDPSLIEMGIIYRAKRKLMLKEIYIPGISSHVISGLSLSAGLGVRIVVLAEVLGAYSGIGHRFSLARTNLETDELYAWIIVCLAIVGFLEFLLFKPARKHMNRWKKDDEGKTLND